MTMQTPSVEGLLLINKPRGKTSFSLVAALRRRLGVQKIGHSGTLDPFATGVMVMLIGKNYTRKQDQFLSAEKEYLAEMHLGIATDTYDCDGETLSTSALIPSQEELEKALTQFQGEIQQIPPMFSAKKIKGKKLYDLARAGITVDRSPVTLHVKLELVSYVYPHVKLLVTCSKGTYIRSLAHDIGLVLGSGAHLSQLCRTRSGNFHIADCLDGELINSQTTDIVAKLLKA